MSREYPRVQRSMFMKVVYTRMSAVASAISADWHAPLVSGGSQRPGISNSTTRKIAETRVRGNDVVFGKVTTAMMKLRTFLSPSAAQIPTSHPAKHPKQHWTIDITGSSHHVSRRSRETAPGTFASSRHGKSRSLHSALRPLRAGDSNLPHHVAKAPTMMITYTWQTDCAAAEKASRKEWPTMAIP